MPQQGSTHAISSFGAGSAGSAGLCSALLSSSDSPEPPCQGCHTILNGGGR